MTEQTHKIHLIGISGKIGSGKSTLSELFLQRWPEFKRASFAEALRQVLGILLDMPVSEMRTQQQKNAVPEGCSETVGELLQRYGDGLRQIESVVWVRALFRHFDPEQSYWIIDDMRYRNEADRIRQAGGLLIRLDGDPGNKRAESRRDLEAVSETELDDYAHFDLRINTDVYRDRPQYMFERLLESIEKLCNEK
jgi:hypothetical protein